MANLLPCPFCGSTKILFTDNENRVGYHYCKKCWGSVGPECQTFTESVHNWNKRAYIMEGANLQTHNSAMVPCDCKSKCHKVCDIVACDECGKEWRD